MAGENGNHRTWPVQHKRLLQGFPVKGVSFCGILEADRKRGGERFWIAGNVNGFGLMIAIRITGGIPSVFAGEKALFSAGISESEKEPALPPIKKPVPGLSRPAAPVTAGIKTVQSDAAGAVPADVRRLPMRFFPARFPKSAAGPAWAFRFHPKLPSPDKPC